MTPNMTKLKLCILCQRNVPYLTNHHIIPKNRGGTKLVAICRDCHRQIHALFENKTLEVKLNTVETIMANEQFIKYLTWIEKRPFGSIHRTRRSKDSRKRGRRG